MIVLSNKFLGSFKKCHGAFSVCEAIALYNIVLDAPEGEYLELGSHKGKSSMVIASAMPLASHLFLVEPEFENTEWAKDVSDKILNYRTRDRFSLIAGYSLDVIPKHNGLSFVFVDSGVHDDMVMDEVKMLEDKVISGGVIAFHDYLNQFTAVERAYNYLMSTGKYEKINIDWNRIFDYVRENNLEDGNNSWHEKGSEEFPKFVGAVRKKDIPDFVHRY